MLKVLSLFSVLGAGAFGNYGNFGNYGGYYGGNFGNLPNFGFGMPRGTSMIMPNGYPVINPFTGHMGAYDVFNGLQNSHKAFGSTNDVTTDCRMYKRTHNEEGDEMTPDKCRKMRQRTYNPWAERIENIGGACRWQASNDEGGNSDGWRGACLCPATGDLCTRNRKGCHLHVNRETKEETCIGKPERFYNQLAGMLSKRGKKDFSMRIQYGAAGAPGRLPFGLLGPAFVGRANPYIDQHMDQAYGNFGSQGYGNYGFAPTHQYRAGPGSYGGFGGYGPHGAYSRGAAAWSNPASPHQPPFSQWHGYGAPWAPHFPTASNQRYQTPPTRAYHPVAAPQAAPHTLPPAAATQQPAAATTQQTVWTQPSPWTQPGQTTAWTSNPKPEPEAAYEPYPWAKAPVY